MRFCAASERSPCFLLPMSRHGPYWFWVPVVATSLGAVIGGLLYSVLIEAHHDTVYSVL